MADRRVTLPVHQFSRPDLCGPCGGACCKSIPGEATPEDFGAPDREAMRLRIEAARASGRWSLCLYYGGHDAAGVRLADIPFLRPMQVAPDDHCTFLRADGCELKHDDRPSECRALEPRETGECHRHFVDVPYLDRVRAWLEYEDLFAQWVAEDR